MRTHVIIPDKLLEEIDKLVGSRKRSTFISKAIERELKHERLIESAKAAAGSFKDVDIPGWETSESAAEWVHDLRHEEDAKLEELWKK